MIGWYRNEKKDSKPNMERIYSFEGKVVLYKRLIGTGNTPYALFKNNSLIANVSELPIAIREYHECIAAL